LPGSFGDLSNLLSAFDENSLTEMPSSISKLATLKELRLMDNKLKELPGSIGNMKNLTSLDLRNNLLESGPKSIYELKNLRFLVLEQTDSISFRAT